MGTEVVTLANCPRVKCVGGFWCTSIYGEADGSHPSLQQTRKVEMLLMGGTRLSVPILYRINQVQAILTVAMSFILNNTKRRIVQRLEVATGSETSMFGSTHLPTHSTYTRLQQRYYWVTSYVCL